jgi:hypothetical protein
MNSFRAFATAILAACFLLGPVTVPAIAAAKKPLPPPDVRTLVKSVDKANSSIVILLKRDNNITHTYRLDDLTKILIDGSSAKFADIKAGMEVSDSTERDTETLDSISLLSKTSAPTLADLTPDTGTGADKTIQTVLADKSSVVIFFAKSKIQRTYHIDASTSLTVNGAPGAFGDIKAGMEVKDYTERDNDDLDSLTVSGGY